MSDGFPYSTRTQISAYFMAHAAIYRYLRLGLFIMDCLLCANKLDHEEWRRRAPVERTAEGLYRRSSRKYPIPWTVSTD